MSTKQGLRYQAVRTGENVATDNLIVPFATSKAWSAIQGFAGHGGSGKYSAFAGNHARSVA
jgi:hypothetical protein